MWLHEFAKRFPEATEKRFGKRQELGQVEDGLADARKSGRVTRSDLEKIETSKAWDYQDSWRRLSKSDLPQEEVSLPGPRREAIGLLYDWLKHIEVVSVVLRFLYPENFGILSPPVASLINLAPRAKHVEYYWTYVTVLSEIGSPYGLTRVADIDMGLWVAAHVGMDYSPHLTEQTNNLTKQMNRDEQFQVIRLKNLLEGLRDRRGARNQSQWLRLVATAMSQHDTTIASLLLAPAFEKLVFPASSRPCDRSAAPARRGGAGTLRGPTGARKPLEARNPPR